MSHFAPDGSLDADDAAPTEKVWRRVRAAVTFFTPGAKRFKSVAFELYDIAPEFPRMEAVMTAWRERTGAQVVEIEFEQSEDLAPVRDALHPDQRLH